MSANAKRTIRVVVRDAGIVLAASALILTITASFVLNFHMALFNAALAGSAAVLLIVLILGFIGAFDAFGNMWHT